MRIGTIAAMIAIPVSSFGAIWFDAAVSGYGSWPADGSPKVVEVAGSWTNTSVATYDFSRKRILVDSECDSSLDFAPLAPSSVESKQVDVTSVVRFLENTALHLPRTGAIWALTAACKGGAAVFFRLSIE